MKFLNFAMLAIATVVATSHAGAQGQDQFVWGISGGVIIPSGIASVNHTTGPNGGVMFGIGGIDSPFGVRFDGTYAKLGSKSGAGTLGLGSARLLNFSGNAIITLYGQEKKLYFVGGAGAFKYKPSTGVIIATTDLGLNAGLGVWFPDVDGFIEARWFDLFRALPDPVTHLRGKTSIRVYPISVGFLF